MFHPPNMEDRFNDGKNALHRLWPELKTKVTAVECIVVLHKGNNTWVESTPFWKRKPHYIDLIRLLLKSTGKDHVWRMDQLHSRQHIRRLRSATLNRHRRSSARRRSFSDERSRVDSRDKYATSNETKQSNLSAHRLIPTTQLKMHRTKSVSGSEAVVTLHQSASYDTGDIAHYRWFGGDRTLWADSKSAVWYNRTRIMTYWFRFVAVISG